ncbi:MAG: HipA domain-containing protein [Alphaproteobacteria bacterium]|nr:HipA domain-containing protein [Alphaproteobacteria bacterium]
MIERFDIRRSDNDRRKISLEDMASIRDVAPSDKYEGSIEQVARALRGVSSNAEADILVLLGRAVFA